ncbi:MAG: HPr family phosphocarrier protein, partial [Planctomycetales bacterium]|nr:HPr family phosphocarrier protein [Planctomycetales bacterium]
MSDSVLTRTVTVRNPHGLHARPADLLSQLATQFEAEIHICKNHERVDG